MDRRELARHAPSMPDVLPPRVKGKPKVTDFVEPHANALYKEEPDFRVMVGSLTAEEAVHGSVKYDQVIAAQMVTHRAEKKGDQSLTMFKLARVGTAVTHWARRYGIARSQRLVTASKTMHLSATPAE
jgi:hypothetical protein